MIKPVDLFIRTVLKFLFLSMLIWLFSPNISAAGSFTIAPGVLNFEMPNPQPQTILVVNPSDEPLRIRVEPIYFPIDSKFVSLGTPSKENLESDSIAEQIIVSPKFFTLVPEQKRKIRVFIRPPYGKKPGDYRAHLLIQSLEPAKSEKKGSKGDEFKVSIKIKLETAAAVYARLGKPAYKLVMKCSTYIYQGKNIIELNSLNDSPWKYDGWLGIYDSNGKDAHPLAVQRLLLLRESKRIIRFENRQSQQVFIRWGEKSADESPFHACESKKMAQIGLHSEPRK